MQNVKVVFRKCKKSVSHEEKTSPPLPTGRQATPLPRERGAMKIIY